MICFFSKLLPETTSRNYNTHHLRSSHPRCGELLLVELGSYCSSFVVLCALLFLLSIFFACCVHVRFRVSNRERTWGCRLGVVFQRFSFFSFVFCTGTTRTTVLYRPSTLPVLTAISPAAVRGRYSRGSSPIKP